MWCAGLNIDPCGIPDVCFELFNLKALTPLMLMFDHQVHEVPRSLEIP